MSLEEISSGDGRRKAEGRNSFKLYVNQRGTSGLADTRMNPKNNSPHSGGREEGAIFPCLFLLRIEIEIHVVNSSRERLSLCPYFEVPCSWLKVY